MAVLPDGNRGLSSIWEEHVTDARLRLDQVLGPRSAFRPREALSVVLTSRGTASLRPTLPTAHDTVISARVASLTSAAAESLTKQTLSQSLLLKNDVLAL